MVAERWNENVGRPFSNFFSFSEIVILHPLYARICLPYVFLKLYIYLSLSKKNKDYSLHLFDLWLFFLSFCNFFQLLFQWLFLPLPFSWKCELLGFLLVLFSWLNILITLLREKAKRRTCIVWIPATWIPATWKPALDLQSQEIIPISQ